MDDIAKAARISRPGLYFLFESKPVLFREAVVRGLDRDLDLIAQELSNAELPLAERLIAAFDRWAGSYVGPLADDLSALINTDPALLGSILDDAPRRFAELIGAAVSQTHPRDGAARTQTLISASIGIKHQVSTRDSYLEHLAVAVELLFS